MAKQIKRRSGFRMDARASFFEPQCQVFVGLFTPKERYGAKKGGPHGGNDGSLQSIHQNRERSQIAGFPQRECGLNRRRS